MLLYGPPSLAETRQNTLEHYVFTTFFPHQCAACAGPGACAANTSADAAMQVSISYSLKGSLSFAAPLERRTEPLSLTLSVARPADGLAPRRRGKRIWALRPRVDLGRRGVHRRLIHPLFRHHRPGVALKLRLEESGVAVDLLQ